MQKNSKSEVLTDLLAKQNSCQAQAPTTLVLRAATAGILVL
jgi:hypothetical protein